MGPEQLTAGFVNWHTETHVGEREKKLLNGGFSETYAEGNSFY